jgi:tRNA G18 (ribose-2'-O)-methylase SpoU
MVLNSKELRRLAEPDAALIQRSLRRWPLYIILENVLDTYNIGGFFRLADAVAAAKVYLCGGCAVPPDPKIVKASVGTYKLVPWEYKKTAGEAIRELKKIKGMSVMAVEQSPVSRDYRTKKYRFPLAFVFGHETDGITPATLALTDAVIELPMYGLNKSLNVMVAAGIALYRAVAEAGKKRLF